MFGFLNVYKPAGMTSHDVVAILRRITGIKQIGHAGTLDPFAEGVLPVAVGKATRLIEYLKDDKAYIGTIQLGSKTTTYDTEGEVTEKSEKHVSFDEVLNASKNFQGTIEQIPPMYSAIKVNGKKLYEYARKGETAEVKPRKVNISEFKILEFDEKNQRVKVYIACSKGTYIRSIANDLGEISGSYGHLSKLVRVRAGDFNVETSITVEIHTPLVEIEKKLINPVEVLHYPHYELNDFEAKAISHGNPIKIDLPDGIVMMTSKKSLSGMGNVSNGILKCKKIFI